MRNSWLVGLGALVVLAVSCIDGGGTAPESRGPLATANVRPTRPPTTTPPLTAEALPATTTVPGEIALRDLGAPVLVYGPDDHDSLRLVETDGERVIWPGPTEVAIPDGRGGVLLQPATEPTIVWVPDVSNDLQRRLVTVAGELLLRGIRDDGRVVYSVRPHPDALTEGSLEEFFAIELAQGAEPERVATSGAYESWVVGPVWVGEGEPIHAGCHLHCSLWPGLTAAPPVAQPLYHGGGAEAGPSAAIGGLVATPDGRVIAFVEFDITLPEASRPELVLLDGRSFNTRARIELSLDFSEQFGNPVVSLSTDAQRVLVALGAPSTDQPFRSVPTTPYLVEGALTASPQVSSIDGEGALRWLDPVAATNRG